MNDGVTHRLAPKVYYYTFGPNEPALVVKSGDRVTVKTRDAYGFDENMNPITQEEKQKSENTELRESNPVVGPIYVEDAQVGDALSVFIEKIALNRPYAWSMHLPNFGSFTGEGPGRSLLLNDPIPEAKYDWNLDLDGMVGTLGLSKSKIGNVEISLHPFIGSIGVAPRYGRVEMTLTPGEYGGNMDCVETKEGTTLYLPVGYRGAYLEFGDIHAAQGDGEICGVGLETTAEVTVRIEVIKGWNIEMPRLEDETHIMSAASSRPFMEALQAAYIDIVKWLVKDYGYEKWEAFQVLSQVGTMRVGNVVDPNYTAVAKFPKRYLS